MQNGQRFVVMYLLYRGSDLLAAPETITGGDRTALQEQGDRQNTWEGQTNATAAGQVVATWSGWKRKINIPETDEDNTQSEVRAGTGAGVPACDIPEHSERHPGASGRERQARDSVGEPAQPGRGPAGATFQQHGLARQQALHALRAAHTFSVVGPSHKKGIWQAERISIG